MKITPVNESLGAENGWYPSSFEKATGFEVDNGDEVVYFTDNYFEAVSYAIGGTDRELYPMEREN